ncbi:LysE family translocator [Ferrovibrio xuzhouensis]|uniref:LysE family translocator n=1 Tax=Ferrovibrio xuzhouensis TaxID=1576914 RepID=A0ABV7VAQ4_9PROT
MTLTAETLLLPLALFALVTSVTPGPNNILLTASGASFGFRRTVPHMLGISAGFFSLLLVCGLGVGALILAEPVVHNALRIAGAGYLVWLAWQLARAGSAETMQRARPMRFHEAALFQYVNPKAWMMAVGAVAAFTTPGGNYAVELTLIAVVFTLINLPCVSLWALFGTGLGQLLTRTSWRRAFNLAMAVLTIASAVLMFV